MLDVGTYIDLTYLNRKVVAPAPRKSLSEEVSHLVEIGTEYIFREEKIAKKIQVVFA